MDISLSRVYLWRMISLRKILKEIKVSQGDRFKIRIKDDDMLYAYHNDYWDLTFPIFFYIYDNGEFQKINSKNLNRVDNLSVPSEDLTGNEYTALLPCEL